MHIFCWGALFNLIFRKSSGQTFPNKNGNESERLKNAGYDNSEFFVSSGNASARCNPIGGADVSSSNSNLTGCMVWYKSLWWQFYNQRIQLKLSTVFSWIYIYYILFSIYIYLQVYSRAVAFFLSIFRIEVLYKPGLETYNLRFRLNFLFYFIFLFCNFVGHSLFLLPSVSNTLFLCYLN